MNEPLKANITLLVLSFFIGFGCLSASGIARAQSQGGSKERRRMGEISRTLRTGDEAAIRELIDLALLVVRSDRPPLVVAPSVKERLIRAEIDYRNGRSEAIPEDNVVRAVNYLAKEFDAPVYAQAQSEEVRELRRGEAYPLFHSLAPNLAAMTEAERQAFPLQINTSMSPIEAVYFTLTLIFQKQFNACNQLTADERSDVATTLMVLEANGLSTLKERGRLRWALCNREVDPDKLHLTPEELTAEVKRYAAERRPLPEKPYLLGPPYSARYLKMRALFKRAYSMKLDDALPLINKTLDLLGLEK